MGLTAEERAILETIPNAKNLIPPPLTMFNRGGIDLADYNSKIAAARQLLNTYKTGGMPAAQSLIKQMYTPQSGGMLSDLGSAFGSLASSGAAPIFLGPLAGGLATSNGLISGANATAGAAGAGTGVGAGGQLLSSAAPIMAPANAAGTGFIGAGAGAGSAGYGVGSGALSNLGGEVAQSAGSQVLQGAGGTGGAAGTVATGAAAPAASSLIPGIANNTLGALASGAASLYGANTAANAATDATAEARRQFDIGQANTKPWLDAGKGALTEQQKLMGINGYSPENSLSALTSSPGYQFRLGQGQQALDRSAAAKGMLNSGNVLAATTEYGQNFGSNEYGNRLNQLAGLSGTGQTQANTNFNAGMNYAGDIGNSVLAAGAARQSGILGAGNALSNWLNPQPKQPTFKMVNGQWNYV